MSRIVLSLFFCFVFFLASRAQLNYSFTYINDDHPDSNTDLPSNAPTGAGQRSIVFSSAGFEDPLTILQSSQLSQKFVGQEANIPSTSLTSAKLVPLVIGSSFMTPSAWGAASTFAFASISGTPYQTYASMQRQSSDFLAQLGLGVGNSKKFVSVVGIININDISAVDNFSYSFIASRQLGKLSSISVGALHLFADPKKTDADKSYYLAYSHAIKKTKFSYTIGIGSGKFYENNDLDKRKGKTCNGTAVFANFSYNVLKNVAFSTEWTGRNIAVSSTLMIKPNLPVIALGVSELTRRSGDHPMFFISIGKGFLFNKRKID